MPVKYCWDVGIAGSSMTRKKWLNRQLGVGITVTRTDRDYEVCSKHKGQRKTNEIAPNCPQNRSEGLDQKSKTKFRKTEKNSVATNVSFFNDGTTDNWNKFPVFVFG